MASLFKNAIATVSFPSGEVQVLNASSDSYVIQLDVACTSASGVQITAKLSKSGGGNAHIIKNAPVPVGSTLQILDGQKLVLAQGDSIVMTCDTPGGSVDAIVSYVAGVNS